MKSVLILGTGLAALIAALYYKDENVILIGDELGGQMNSEISLGPRIIQKDDNVEKLIFDILKFKNINIKNAIIKYNYNNVVYDLPPQNFIKKYALKSRNSDKVENHIMSENKSIINYYDIEYNIFINKLIDYLMSFKNINFIKTKILKIDKNVITTTDKKINFNDNYILINTLPLFVFKKIFYIDLNDLLVLNSKNILFYKENKGTNNDNIEYHYYIDDKNENPIIRSTYLKKYTIHESILELNNYEFITKIPKISNNYKPYYKIYGWIMFGRFAQWDQKIKLNELMKNFYNNLFYEEGIIYE